MLQSATYKKNKDNKKQFTEEQNKNKKQDQEINKFQLNTPF